MSRLDVLIPQSCNTSASAKWIELWTVEAAHQQQEELLLDLNLLEGLALLRREPRFQQLLRDLDIPVGLNP